MFQFFFHWQELRQTKESTTTISSVMKAATAPTTNTTTKGSKHRNCTKPAIEQFPRPLMGLQARKNGGLILHILAAVYTFMGLAIVCDDYFVSSLDRICEGKCFV